MTVSPELVSFINSVKVHSGPATAKGDHPEHLGDDYYHKYAHAQLDVWNCVKSLGLDQQGMDSSDYLGIIKYASNEGWPGIKVAMEAKQQQGWTTFSADVWTAKLAFQWLVCQQK